MRKPGKNIIFFLCVLIMMFFGCAKTENREENNEEQQQEVTVTEKNEMLTPKVMITQAAPTITLEEENSTTIVWAIPDRMTAKELNKNVTYLNEKLAKDNYNFSLEIKALSDITYQNEVIPLLKSGAVDIASLGMKFADGSAGYPQELIRQGYFEELSGYLSSEEGKELKEYYCKSEWKIVETDGGIYSLPNQQGMQDNGFIAFNKKYVTEELLREFHGDILELEALLDKISIPNDVCPIVGEFSIGQLTAMSGNVNIDGALIDLETGVAINPFRQEEWLNKLEVQNRLYKKGYLKHYSQNSTEIESEILENRSFVAWLGFEYGTIYENLKEEVIVVPIQFSMQSALSCTSGISKNSQKKDEALQLLTLLYTNEEYANILFYGQLGVDYQLLDGYVYDMDGTTKSSYRASLQLGIYDPLYPCVRDDMTVQRREMKENVYASQQCLPSVVLGFQTNYEEFSIQMKNLKSLVNKYFTALQQTDDFASMVQGAANMFESSGGNNLVDELNRQITEWMKIKNR